MTSNGLIGVSAILLLALLSNCAWILPDWILPDWITLEGNLGNSIVEQRLDRHELTLGSMKEKAFLFQKNVIEDLEKGGHLRSSDLLREYLSSSGMDCSSPSSAKQTCRFSRYRIERLISGDPRDGANRIDWNVVVTWNKSDSPVHPSATMERMVQIVNKVD